MKDTKKENSINLTQDKKVTILKIRYIFLEIYFSKT